MVEQANPKWNGEGLWEGRYGQCYEYKDRYEIFWCNQDIPMQTNNLRMHKIKRVG